MPVVANVKAGFVRIPRNHRSPCQAGDRNRPLAGKRSVHAQDGVTRFVEVGTGKVLSGLVKRIADGVSTSQWERRTISPGFKGA